MRSYSSGLRPWRSRTFGVDHAAVATSAPTLDDCDDRFEYRRRPSALPSAGSQARSGCGIRPTTLRASLQMPAIALTDPFGFASSSTSPAAVGVAEDHLPVRFEPLRSRRARAK